METLRDLGVSCADQRAKVLAGPQTSGTLEFSAEDLQPKQAASQAELVVEESSLGQLPVALEVANVPAGCMPVEFFTAYQNS